jgi:hypothetical protein
MICCIDCAKEPYSNMLENTCFPAAKRVNLALFILGVPS